MVPNRPYRTERMRSLRNERAGHLCFYTIIPERTCRSEWILAPDFGEPDAKLLSSLVQMWVTLQIPNIMPAFVSANTARIQNIHVATNATSMDIAGMSNAEVFAKSADAPTGVAIDIETGKGGHFDILSNVHD